MLGVLLFLSVPLPIGAHVAEAQLERATQIAINQDGGDTDGALRPLTSLGQAATPALLRLARSKNPVTRAAAAMGLGMVRSERGRKMLQQLFHDRTLVTLADGCELREVAVGWFADRALDHYPPK